MQINAVLLFFALSLYWGGDISTWQAVQRVNADQLRKIS